MFRPALRNVLAASAIAIASVAATPTANAAVTYHTTETLGAYSETHNRWRDGHVYELHTYVRDTIQDHHLCAYVKYEIQYKQGFRGIDTGWITTARANYRVNACDGDRSEVATLDMDQLHTTITRITAFRLRVSTCEDIPRHTDRCSKYYTLTRHP